MRAGTLRHRVAIQRLTQGVDAYGGATETWATVATVWASVESVTGREYFAGAQVQSEVTTKVRIRYRSGIVPTMRVVHASRVMEVQAVLPDARSKELLLMCRDVSSAQG